MQHHLQLEGCVGEGKQKQTWKKEKPKQGSAGGRPRPLANHVTRSPVDLSPRSPRGTQPPSAKGSSRTGKHGPTLRMIYHIHPPPPIPKSPPLLPGRNVNVPVPRGCTDDDYCTILEELCGPVGPAPRGTPAPI